MKTIGAVKLAEVLGVSKGEITRLVQDGMPHEGNRFSLGHCLVWFVRHLRGLLDRNSAGMERADQDALHGARQRLVSTQASHAESDLKISSGDHIDRDALELLMLNKLRAVRELIMGISSRYGYRVVACEEKEILSTLLNGSDVILSNLSGSAADTYMEGRNARQDPIRQV